VRSYLLLSALLLFSACHNNAHIRTQRPLQADEKVMSINTALPLGGASDYRRFYYDQEGTSTAITLGIVGPRVIVSSLTGKSQSETGFYGGLGLAPKLRNQSSIGLVLGAQRKNYLSLFGSTPKKIGAIVELNILSEGGPLIQVFPSITTTTNIKKSYYFGVHGIIVSGINRFGFVEYEIYNLEQERYYPERVSTPFKYNSNSLGIGLSIGTEIVLNKKSSFQLQMDFSIVNNSFTNSFQPKEKWNNIDYMKGYMYGDIILTQRDETSFLNKINDGSHFIVSGSMGYNFFKPPPSTKQPISPLPPLQKNMFNPETGEKLKEAALVFDPETGEIITPSNESPYFEEYKITDRQLVDLAKRNAQEKHVFALWSVFGLMGVPSSAFGSILGLFIIDEASDGAFAFPGFILGGIFGATLPSALAKASSRLANVNYPPEIETKEQEMEYKKTYRSEVGVLRQKSTTIGTIGGFGGLAAFILLVIIGN